VSTEAFRTGFVAIVGRPNAGKSTLLNRVVGQELAVVTPRPQTTRTRILAVTNLPAAQLILLDTPGFHKPRSALNKSMVRATVSALGEVDTALVVVEVSETDRPPDPGRAIDALVKRIRDADLPAVLALNKIDQVPKPAVLHWIAALRGLYPWRAIVPISALKGDGVDGLVGEVVATLPEGPALYPEEMLTDRAERFFISELVREQILLQVREEIPYSAGVEVEEFRDLPQRSHIRCNILVERQTHKKILVGRKGATIKSLGMAARKAAERFLDRPVDLMLFVKVVPRWTRDPRIVERLGYGGE